MVKLIEFIPATPDAETQGDGALGFFAGLATLGLKAAIPNLNAKLGAIVGPKTALPYVVSVDGGGLCYLAGFTRMYMDGAADELGSSGNTLLRLFAPSVAVSGHAARALGMDDVVTVNNNLHSTCHVGDWSGLDIGAMTAALIAKYPRHAIWVRGLNDRLHADELARLKVQDYVVAPSRPVEILDPTVPDWKIASNLKKDFKKLDRLPDMKPIVGGPFSDADFAAMERFCRSATVERHSKLMPHYTAAFFRACAAWPDCHFVGLRDSAGALRGFATMFYGATRITCGTLGYDLNDEHARPIYPALSGMEMQQAIEAKLPFNIGYGATEFKRVRGTTPALELNAFYIRHLPIVKRNLWQATLSAMGQLAGAVMKRL